MIQYTVICGTCRTQNIVNHVNQVFCCNRCGTPIVTIQGKKIKISRATEVVETRDTNRN